MHQLFETYAHRYDLHTPPGHYKHDHAFVLDRVASLGRPHTRLFDVGCGTGVFLELAIANGIDAHGADAAEGMVRAAADRLTSSRVRVERMQDFNEVARYDVITALSWTLHYCDDEADLRRIVSALAKGLTAGGLLLLQVANPDRMNVGPGIDREPGPEGQPDDILFIHRFSPQPGPDAEVLADYIYVGESAGELLVEQHRLRCCDPELVAGAMRDAGLEDVSIVDLRSVSPFVAGRAR
jgi:SAM-dependent methyltransferase